MNLITLLAGLLMFGPGSAQFMLSGPPAHAFRNFSSTAYITHVPDPNIHIAGTRTGSFSYHLIAGSEHLANTPPIANDDYFNGGEQGFGDTIRANVYGGFTAWSSKVREGFSLRSLSTGPAVESGADYDMGNHSLADMSFVILGGEVVYTGGACDTLDLSGNVKWSKDGTFEYIRLSKCIDRITFQYKITAPSGLESDTARVTVDFISRKQMPAHLSNFTVKKDGGQVKLHWEILSPDGIKGYYVQRNTCGRWINRGYVPIHHDASGVTGNYVFSDMTDFSGSCLYRLMIMDENDFVRFSEERLLRITEDLEVVIYPNPSSIGSVSVELPDNGGYLIGLYEASGIKHVRYETASTKHCTISGLGAGIYIMRIVSKRGSRLTFRTLIIL